MSKVTAAWMVGLACCMCAGAALAAPCSMEVSPLTLELQLVPGRAHTGHIQITNAGDGAEHIRAYAQDWTLKPDGVIVFLPAGRLPSSASVWVTIAPTEFDLQPGQSQRVRYTIRVPEETSGEARTVIIFEAGGRDLSISNGPSRLVPRVGTIFYVHCGPRPAGQARVLRFEPSREAGTMTVENAGPAHLRFTGELEIRSEGKLVRRCVLRPFVVLPAPFNIHRARLGPDLFAGLPAGHYEFTAILDHGGTALLGARAEVDLGPGPPVLIASEE